MLADCAARRGDTTARQDEVVARTGSVRSVASAPLPRGALLAFSVLACPQAARADIFEDEDGEWHISSGAVAGIIVAAVLFVIIFVGGMIYRQRRMRRAAGGLPFTGQPPLASQVPAPSPLYTPRADGGFGGYPSQATPYTAQPFGAPPTYDTDVAYGYGGDKSGAYVSDATVLGSGYPPPGAPPAAHLSDK